MEDLSDLLSEYDLPQGMYVCMYVHVWTIELHVHVYLYMLKGCLGKKCSYFVYLYDQGAFFSYFVSS